MNNILLDFVSVTEEAALAAFPWVGRGNKFEADSAATEAMRIKLNAMSIDASVVIGEGEIDEAPMLYIGESLGLKCGPQLDIAVDPLEGTILAANHMRNAIAVIAAAPKGSLLHAPDMYMEKIVVGAKAAGKIDINAPILETIKIVAAANDKTLSDLNVAIQDRDRHQTIIESVRKSGARVHLFDHGDVIYSIAALLNEHNIDLFLGTGGAPEGVISAVAAKCLGGEMQGRLLPGNKEEYNRCIKMGLSDPGTVLKMDQLVVSDECIFAATGITDSFLLKGVRMKDSDQQITHSIVINGAHKRLRFINTVHHKKISG